MNEDLQQQLIKDLLVESYEGLDRFDNALLELEQGGASAETMNQIFRIIHTIKGTSGCIGLSRLEKVAHAGENLLDELRSGEREVHSGIVSVLLELSDALRSMLENIETNGNEGTTDFSALLGRLQDPPAESAPAPAPAQPAAAATPEPAAPAPAPTPEPQASVTPEPAAKQAPEPADAPPAGWGLFDEDSAPAPATEAAPAKAEAPKPAAAAKPTAKPTTPSEGSNKPSVAESAIRVDVNQLDKLMNLVGELVLARNQILQFANAGENSLLNAAQRLNIITTELQEGVMKTRMQQIGSIWSKYPRVIRDLCHDLGKKVELVMTGQETELDRTVIESVKDPLMHILRNSVDHGIEMPDKRVAAGKPETGMLVLRAFHEGGQVNIEIMDDGAGINVARVKAKAVERGVVTSEQATRMSDREAFNLIFSPGFSTAEKVTNVSGRGVGMDVVKTNIEKIGGSVDVHSEPGRSTTIKIKIPLTLAIIPALIVSSGEERFAIPQVSLVELVHVESGHESDKIEHVHGAPVYRLRGKLLPLAFLNRELKLDANGKPSGSHGGVNIVVLQADGRQFGLVVDQINDTEEIVVKPLSKQLKCLSCFAGATIMGDGHVALILDVMGLAQHSHLVAGTRDQSLAEERATSSDSESEKQTLLLFDVGGQSRLAIPLSLVARLEEIQSREIEKAGGQEVVQYRGQIMPLIRVNDYLGHHGDHAGSKDTPLQVVVYSEQGRSVGLVVSHINDIVEEHVTVRREARSSGITGSAVIHDKVTDLLDVRDLIRRADPAFYQTVGTN